MDRPTLSLLDALPISALPAEAGPTWILTLGRSKVGYEERVASVQGEARMADARPKKLDRPVDVRRDHVLGNPRAAMTLVEYGSYACPYCHAAHEVIADLRHRFGDRMRYVFRHRPITDSEDAERAAALAEYAFGTTGKFWPIHDALMKRGPVFGPDEFVQVAAEFDLPPREEGDASAYRTAERGVQEDARSARRSGAMGTPPFFINNRSEEHTPALQPLQS